MSKHLDSFPVRMGRRFDENHGKVCPVCGQGDPFLIGKDGLCANCSSGHKEEEHHLLGRRFRVDKEDEKAFIPISPNAHRLVSDMQADHPRPPLDDPDSRGFLESWCLEFLAGLVELWIALTYLHEQPDVAQAIPWLMLIPLLGLVVANLDRLDLSNLVERARMKLHEEQAR